MPQRPRGRSARPLTRMARQLARVGLSQRRQLLLLPVLARVKALAPLDAAMRRCGLDAGFAQVQAAFAPALHFCIAQRAHTLRTMRKFLRKTRVSCTQTRRTPATHHTQRSFKILRRVARDYAV